MNNEIVLSTLNDAVQYINNIEGEFIINVFFLQIVQI